MARTPPTAVRCDPALLAALDASIDGQRPRVSRPEGVRRLVERGLAGQPTPEDNELAELRQKFIMLARKVDGLVAYTRQLEAQRDGLAARAPRLEVVRRPGEQSAVRQPPRAVPAVQRWPADPIRGLTQRLDPEAVARARAQLAAAEEAARRREEGVVPQD